MLAEIQSDYKNQGVKVVAINIWPEVYPLDQWVDFWKGTGAGDVLWGQDVNGTTVKDYRLVALGTEIIVDRQGQLAFRSDGASGYQKLRSQIEKVLYRSQQDE